MITAEQLSNWKTIADVAWEQCDDRKLSQVEKIAVTIKAIAEARDPFRVSCLLVPMPQRAVCAVLRTHMDVINAVLGTRYRYQGASYHASGAGAFGRFGGGKRGSYNEPTILEWSTK